VLFDIRELISSTESESLLTVKITLTLLFTTVISFELSGTADAKVHSSSSFVAVEVLCARLDEGAGEPTPSRSAEPACCGFTDCWNWKGEACLGAGELRAAKGSGVERAACARGAWEMAGGGGEDI
jgi:hypothetical protein